MWRNKTTRSLTVCGSPLPFEVLSGETSGRSLPRCGTGPETPSQERREILS